jgi:hypothetical protein
MRPNILHPFMCFFLQLRRRLEPLQVSAQFVPLMGFSKARGRKGSSDEIAQFVPLKGFSKLRRR